MLEVSPGQLRLREVVQRFTQEVAPQLPADGRSDDRLALLRELQQRLAADPLVRGDARTAMPLTAAHSHATYARVLAARGPSTVADTASLAGIETHVYGRPDLTSALIACSGGVKWPSTMAFLVMHAQDVPRPVAHASVTVLRNSRISLEAAGEHRALAAFLYAGTLHTAHQRVTLVEDRPSVELREACGVLDRFASVPDGFALPVTLSDDQIHRLADRLAGIVPRPCSYLDELQAIADGRPLPTWTQLR